MGRRWRSGPGCGGTLRSREAVDRAAQGDSGRGDAGGGRVDSVQRLNGDACWALTWEGTRLVFDPWLVGPEVDLALTQAPALPKSARYVASSQSDK